MINKLIISLGVGRHNFGWVTILGLRTYAKDLCYQDNAKLVVMHGIIFLSGYLFQKNKNLSN